MALGVTEENQGIFFAVLEKGLTDYFVHDRIKNNALDF